MPISRFSSSNSDARENFLSEIGVMLPTGEQTEMEKMKLMAQLLQKLSQRETAAIFNQPVVASEYPDYHEIVSTPMDLGTIQENNRLGRYASIEACAKDVRIVWTNAFLYNPSGSIVAQSAHALSKTFEERYNKINPGDFNYEREPSVEERHKFSRDIYRVEDSQLVQAVEILEKRCPEAVVRDNEDGYFVVKVDALPSPVFWEVQLFLRRRLFNQRDRTKKKIPTTFQPTPESMVRLSGRKRRSSGDGVDSEENGSDQGACRQDRASSREVTANGDKEEGRRKVKSISDGGDVVGHEATMKRAKKVGGTSSGGGGLGVKTDKGDYLEPASLYENESVLPTSWTGQGQKKGQDQAMGADEEGGLVVDIGGGGVEEDLYSSSAALPDASVEIDFSRWLDDPVDTSFREGGGLDFGIGAAT